MKFALVTLLIIAGLSMSAQSVILSDFENNGAFSPEGTEAYCDTSWLQGSTDTPSPDSDWSLMLPTSFNTCPSPGWSGVFFRMDGLVPGDQVNIRFWVKAETGYVAYQVWAFEPTIGVLPNDPESSMGSSFFFSGAAPASTTWYQAWMPFELPTDTSWPSDLYLEMYFHPDVPTDEYALIDDVQMEMVLSTAIHPDHTRPALRLSPVPASDQVRVDGLPTMTRPIQVFNARGERVPAPFNTGSGILDIEHLSRGLYMVRSGDRSGRFLKD